MLRIQEVIDVDDKNLKGLLHDIGKEVYDAVMKALTEMNEYNPMAHRNVVLELSNFKEERRATLKEGITFVADRYLGPFIFRDHVNSSFFYAFCSRKKLKLSK